MHLCNICVAIVNGPSHVIDIDVLWNCHHHDFEHVADNGNGCVNDDDGEYKRAYGIGPPKGDRVHPYEKARNDNAHGLHKVSENVKIGRAKVQTLRFDMFISVI